ncbi:MAG: hypothetical protein KAU17_06550 [Spirochaetales bacterium]|nr:hypothetical protein [Spirochaetales bacterium]
MIRRSVECSSREIKGLKTDTKGATAKPVVFSQKLESVLTMLEFKGVPKEELFFTVEDRVIGLGRLISISRHP